MNNWQELESKYFLQTGRRVPVTLVRGEGTKVWDDEGREYLDFVGGWACASLGHCHPVIVEAVNEQVKTLIQTSNYYYTIPQLKLAQLLVKNSCLDRIYFCNSGAEANEGAIKLARRYGQLKRNGAYEIITAINSFHGRTLATTAATGQPRYQKPYIPLPAGFVNVEYNNIEVIKTATTDKTCAVMLEPIEAEGGVNLPDDDYLKQVQAWCDQNGILLVLDEVQTGLGRTGTLFAYEQYGVEPDIMSLAKGLGGGVPIGGFMAKDEACVFSPGEHGSTFGGNCLTCAASYAVVKYIIENDVAGNAGKVGSHCIAELEALRKKHDCITDVRGRGLLIAVEFNSDISGEVLTACLKGGLLVNQLKPNALRFMPSLIISNEDIDKAVGILGEALSSVAK